MSKSPGESLFKAVNRLSKCDITMSDVLTAIGLAQEAATTIAPATLDPCVIPNLSGIVASDDMKNKWKAMNKASGVFSFANFLLSIYA